MTKSISTRSRHILFCAGGFTLIELLVAITIIVILSLLGFTASKAAINQARKSREIGAAKSLVAAYATYPADNNGALMVANYEGSTPGLQASNYKLADGSTPSSASLGRYPFRLAPYLDGKLEGTMLVNRNTEQIKKSFSGNLFNYGVSLCPALGINYYYVGGYSVDGVVSGVSDCATYISQVAKPGSLLVFASGFTEVDGVKIEGRYGVEPPYYRSKLWDTNLHVDARYGGKAVCAFLDGSVRMHSIDELRDMRLWSHIAANTDNANYTVSAGGSTGVGGGGGGRR